VLDYDPWERRGVTMKPEARREQQKAKDAWEGKGDPWSDLKEKPTNVVGGESRFKNETPGRAQPRRNPPPQKIPDAEVMRELQVLAARVDRLERMMLSNAATKAATPAPAPRSVMTIYKVHPDGQTAWVASGSTAGINKGQTFQVTRGGTAVAQVQVSRLWPPVSELSLLWANGKLQRGDVLAPAAAK
jgi:hypothetical protein